MEHSLALSEDGRVFAWGSGKYGALGLGPSKCVAEPRMQCTFAVQTFHQPMHCRNLCMSTCVLAVPFRQLAQLQQGMNGCIHDWCVLNSHPCVQPCRTPSPGALPNAGPGPIKGHSEVHSSGGLPFRCVNISSQLVGLGIGRLCENSIFWWGASAFFKAVTKLCSQLTSCWAWPAYSPQAPTENAVHIGVELGCGSLQAELSLQVATVYLL
jgi:hypothetical protein